jgi:phosphatidylinositol-3-phosphatase
VSCSPRRMTNTISLLAVGALFAACGTSSSTPPSTGAASPAPSTTANSNAAKPIGNLYCGANTGAPTTTKLMVIYEENTNASSIYGSSSAPNMNKYAADCGSAQNYQALTHPSLPNYMASTSGQSYISDPWTSDCDPGGACVTGNDNIFHQVGASGWKAYAESMSSNCQTGSSDPYASKHNPAEYYTDVSAQCPANNVPMGTPASGALHSAVVRGTLPSFSTVTPNLNNDMHNGSTQQADTWLAGWVSQIVAGPDYQAGHLVVLVVWDEGSGDGNAASAVAMIAMSPYITPGTKSSTYFTHYSLLKAAEDVAKVPDLAGAAAANSLRTAFGF